MPTLNSSLKILVATTYGLLTQTCLAEKEAQQYCPPKVIKTAVREASDQPHSIVLSGICLEKVTHIFFTKKEMGATEETVISFEQHSAYKTDLVFPIPKHALQKNTDDSQVGQNLLQLKSCNNSVLKSDCDSSVEVMMPSF